MTLIQDFRAAYLSLWRWVGVFLAAVTVLSWLTNGWALSLADIPQRVVEAYRAVVHPAVEFVFAVLRWHLPLWARDAVPLYFVVGGAVGRTLWGFYERPSSEGGFYGPPVIGRFRSRVAQALAVLISTLCWPLALVSMFMTPYVMRNPNNKNIFSGNRKRYQTWRDERPHYTYVGDLRVIFLLQLTAVAAVCAAAIIAGGGNQ